ncbi:MAG: flagellar basal body P-ring formation protein FlgA [Planctomycetaceae bacterium]|nr:flagellar basal body P-ring formation protein FlgA [Planctomycetaceae bacterium]
MNNRPTGRRTIPRPISTRGVISPLMAMVVICPIAVAGDLLRIHLEETDVVTDRVVKICDVGRVTGENAEAVHEIGEVDLVKLAEDGTPVVIDRHQLIARLLLAGYDGRDVAITGARSVRVRYEGKVAATPVVVAQSTSEIEVVAMEAAAQAALATCFGVTPDAVEARLATPLKIPRPDASRPVTVDAIAPSNPTLGRTRLTLRVFIGGELHQVASGVFDVRLRQQVVLASATLPVGTVLNASNVTYQERWATRRNYVPQHHKLPEWRVRRPIQAGETITSDDLVPVEAADQNPIVIRARDIVQLVARGKGINATVRAAEALDAGRVGDKIRIRNMESQRIVVGEVVSSEEVQVRF